MEKGGIRYSQLNEPEFKEKFVTRDELVQESFNNTNLGLLYGDKSLDSENISFSNVVLNEAKRDLVGYRKPLTDYRVGDLAYTRYLPNTMRLECIVGGTSLNLSDEDTNLFTDNVKVGDILSDGSVKWIVDDIRDGHFVGDIEFRYTLRDGYIELNGQDLEADKYLRLFNFATDNGLMLPSVADWNNNKQGLFCYVDRNLFRVPDFRAMFIRGLDNGRGMDTNRQLGSYQPGTLVGGNDSDTQGANHSIVLDNNDRNSADKPANFASEYLDSKVYYAYSHRLSTLEWGPNANNFYNIVRPRNIALIPQMKY